jgi:hypothetical protein
MYREWPQYLGYQRDDISSSPSAGNQLIQKVQDQTSTASSIPTHTSPVVPTKVTVQEMISLREIKPLACNSGLPVGDCLLAAARCNRKVADIARRRSSQPPMPLTTSENIPRRLWFTALSPLASDGKIPIHFADNVRQTIDTYRSAWKNPDAPATILGDRDCERLIEKHEPKLTKFYKAERQGMYRSDMCRIAALFEGGYYFDLDLVVVWPPVADNNQTFIVGRCAYKDECMLQAFIGSTPRHPVLRMILDSILDIYTGAVEKANWVGTHATYLAIEKWKSRTPSWESQLKVLPEIHVPKMAQSDLALQWLLQRPAKGQRTGVCNYVMIDSDRPEILYFFSRFMGATWCGPQWEC